MWKMFSFRKLQAPRIDGIQKWLLLCYQRGKSPILGISGSDGSRNERVFFTRKRPRAGTPFFTTPSPALGSYLAGVTLNPRMPTVPETPGNAVICRAVTMMSDGPLKIPIPSPLSDCFLQPFCLRTVVCCSQSWRSHGCPSANAASEPATIDRFSRPGRAVSPGGNAIFAG